MRKLTNEDYKQIVAAVNDAMINNNSFYTDFSEFIREGIHTFEITEEQKAELISNMKTKLAIDMTKILGDLSLGLYSERSKEQVAYINAQSRSLDSVAKSIISYSSYMSSYVSPGSAKAPMSYDTNYKRLLGWILEASNELYGGQLKSIRFD